MKGYILTLVAASLTVTVLGILLPEGNVKKYATLISSVIISLSVIAPFRTVFDISEVFEIDSFSLYEMSKEEADDIYRNNLKKEYGKTIEEALSEYGRAYVTLDDNLSVKRIEIYAKAVIKAEDEEKIKTTYKPERLEIIYGEN